MQTEHKALRPTASTISLIETGALEHLFVDDDGVLRDSHIESMFSTVFYGSPLSDTFKYNFRLYFTEMFCADDKEFQLPEEVFTDHEWSKNFISGLFGLTHISPIRVDLDDPDFDHCAFTGVLRTRYSDTGEVYVNAMTKEYVCLLLIIEIMRWAAAKHFVDKGLVE